jgi:hypothetical protein
MGGMQKIVSRATGFPRPQYWGECEEYKNCTPIWANRPDGASQTTSEPPKLTLATIQDANKP